MTLTKFCRSLRKPRVTTIAGLVTFERLTKQLGLLDSLEAPDFQKLYDHVRPVRPGTWEHSLVMDGLLISRR